MLWCLLTVSYTLSNRPGMGTTYPLSKVYSSTGNHSTDSSGYSYIYAGPRANTSASSDYLLLNPQNPPRHETQSGKKSVFGQSISSALIKKRKRFAPRVDNSSIVPGLNLPLDDRIDHQPKYISQWSIPYWIHTRKTQEHQSVAIQPKDLKNT
jgi:hypothetical protein